MTEHRRSPAEQEWDRIQADTPDLAAGPGYEPHALTKFAIAMDETRRAFEKFIAAWKQDE